jgi:hypothetical protein
VRSQLATVFNTGPVDDEREDDDAADYEDGHCVSFRAWMAVRIAVM